MIVLYLVSLVFSPLEWIRLATYRWIRHISLAIEVVVLDFGYHRCATIQRERENHG
jgi:hypothetical protein